MMETKIPRSGRTVEKELFIQAPPERVFHALTNQAELERWFVKKAEIDLRPGGAVRLEWDPGDIEHGEILAVEPPHLFRYTWMGSRLGTTVVTYELVAEGEGTRLRLIHTGIGEDEDWDQFYNGVNSGWSDELENLRNWLEVGKEKAWI